MEQYEVGRLAVDGWAVTFGTARKDLAGQPAQVPPRCTKCNSPAINGHQWCNRLTGGPWTNYIKGPIPHFEFTEEFFIIKVLTKITIKHKTTMKCEVDVHKKISCRVE